MKNRDFKGPTSTDLLVCFPTRAHLTLMPKRICSPARPSDSGNNYHHQNFQRHQHNHHSNLKNPINRKGASGHSSPSLWSKNKPTTSDISEPTSPKVTCAGQIRVSHKTNKCKNWQSVMEEIEKLHNKKQKKKTAWVETLGFKKEVMQFLTCLRSLRLDFRCFGSIPGSDVISDDEDEDEDEEEEDDDFDEKCGNIERDEDHEASKTVFSKWFMVLQEDKNKNILENQFKEERSEQCVPPPNALLLMRCRSAPAKSYLEEKEDEDEEGEEGQETEDDEEHEVEKDKNEEAKGNLRFLMEEEKRGEKETLEVINYDIDLARFSSDIAKETWVVGGIKGSLSRCRSWKR